MTFFYHLTLASSEYRSTLFIWLDLKRPDKARHLKSTCIVNKIFNGNRSSMRRIYGKLFDNTGQPMFLKDIILKLRSEIKVTVTPTLYTTHRDPKMRRQNQI